LLRAGVVLQTSFPAVNGCIIARCRPVKQLAFEKEL
jgi:hypothetical protein